MIYRFLYWTETASSTSTTSLSQLDLRVNDITSPTQLSAAQTKRRRRSYRLKRQSNLSMVTSLTSALAQDPMTAELLVCDSVSGNILRCSSIDESCTVLVKRSSLVLPDGQTADGKNISVAHL